MLFQADDAFARRKKVKGDFTKSKKYASLIVNASTGDVIHQKNANGIRHPASLTKMMTLYLTFEAIDNGKLSLNQRIPVSVKAASMPRTHLGLRKGQKITVRDAIMGLIVRSANDAAVVLAEAIAGSEAKFAKQMTRTARELGMSKTIFKNASGLPNRKQVTTAYDMARLGIALRRDYPQYYPLFAKKSFKFRGSIISSHNKVLAKYPWADGLKTGFIRASGFNLVTSTTHKNGKLVGVVLGGSTANARDNHMIKLLDRSYAKINSVQVAKRSKSPFNHMFNKPTRSQNKRIALKKRKTERPSQLASVFDAIDAKPKIGLIQGSPFVHLDKAKNKKTQKVSRNKAKLKKVGNKQLAKLSEKNNVKKKRTLAAKKTKRSNKKV